MTGFGAATVPSALVPPAPLEKATRPAANTAGRPAPRTSPTTSTLSKLSTYVINVSFGYPG